MRRYPYRIASFNYLPLVLSLFCLCCLSMGCEPKAPDCISDSDCPTGQQCANGVCKASNGRCRAGEKQGCYTGKAGTRNVGLCRDGTQTCTPAGVWDTKCEGETLPQTDVCDGKDNDCNGTSDDGAQGKEECDGIDNDCDGRIDNLTNTDQPLSRSCYTGPAGTSGKGPCKEGTQSCVGGQWATCAGETLPGIEVCSNQIDDDCDGKVDNVDVGQPCTDPNRKGECTKGIQACGAGGKKECQPIAKPIAEVCNGKDDDCDGGIDNVPNTQDPLPGQLCPYTGPAGTDRKGACKAGTKACVGGTWSTTCVGEVVPGTEVCDGKDNNCDGIVDENLARACYSGPTGTKGVGPCKGGNQTCNAGKWGNCAGEIIPQDELCNNGKDENCNGKVDDVGDLGAFCLDATRNGNCRQGVYVCEGQKRVCKQRTQPTTEICDGNDNDCDGNIDNVKGKSDPLTRPCYTGAAATKGKGSCKDGTQRCALGRWQTHCEKEQRPHVELCNQKDDDCDGKTDEDGACAACTTGSTRPCFDGPLDARGRGGCRDGNESCVNKKWSGQCTGGKGPVVETCNNQDDDCDGVVDNQPGSRDPLRQSCFSGDAAKRGKGACRDGLEQCSVGQWSGCSAQQLPIAEICDGKDNDCNGQTDEGTVCQGTSRKLSEYCTNAPGAPAAFRCGAGAICIQADDNDPASFCFLTCATNADCAKNMDGRPECALLTKTDGICISRVGDGGACDIERGIFCGKDLFCDMNVRRCRGPSIASPLGKCGGRTGHICDQNHLCVPQTPGSAHGYCLKRCKANADCGSAVCLYFSAQEAACSPLGTKKVNQVCGRGDLGTSLDTTRYCAKDLFCARFSPINPDGICHKATGNCADCTSKEFCSAIGSGGLKVCAKICTGPCTTGQDCTQVAAGKSICMPKQPEGIVPFGGLCGPHRLCQKDLFCLSSDPNKFTGFCAKVACNSNGDCPSVPPGAECRSIATNLKACIFPCTSDAQCPTGLACAANLKACFAP